LSTPKSLIVIALTVHDGYRGIARFLVKGARLFQHSPIYFRHLFNNLENVQAGFGGVETSIKWLAISCSLLRLSE
jgi:hypothetical protein